jgi:capsular exopolysaccharide synthesis family protein
MNASLSSSGENADSPLITLAGRAQRFLHFLKSRWWIVVGAVALGLLGQWAFNHFWPPPVLVVSRMLVGGKIRIPDGGLYAEEWQNFFGTQVELMQGEKIRRRTLDRLRRLKQNQNESPVKIEVSQIRKTTIFVLQATGKDTTYTVNYLNALMDEYLAYRREVRSLSSDDTLASLTTQFLEQEKELKRLQEGMLEFQRTNSVALLQEQGSSANLAKLNQQLADLKLQAALVAGVIEPATDSNGAEETATKISLSGVAGDLKPKKALEMLKFQKQEYSQSLLPDHPKMKKLDDEIARVEKLVSLYNAEEMERVTTAKASIDLKIHNVEKAIKEWEDKMLDANRRLAEYTMLKENLDRVQNLYDHLLHLLQNVGLDKHVDQETVVIMDQAVEVPTKARTIQQILAGMIGLILGLGLVGFIATHDDRLTSLEEVKSSFPEKLLGQVPEVPRRKRKPLEPLTAQDPRHVFAESYRAMRSSLLRMGMRQKRARTILVTSAVPGEGKSTVAANLARSLAFGGSRVVLVDGDLRTGTLHESLGLPSEPGLAQLRSGKTGFADLAIPTTVPNLHFIPRGAVSDDCGELFVSGELDRLLEELSTHFDFVLIDCAPAFAAADSLSLAPKVDGTIFVLRRSLTRARMARETLAQLYQLEVQVLGVVFNGAKGSTAFYPYFQKPNARSSRVSGAVVGANAN